MLEDERSTLVVGCGDNPMVVLQQAGCNPVTLGHVRLAQVIQQMFGSSWWALGRSTYCRCWPKWARLKWRNG